MGPEGKEKKKAEGDGKPQMGGWTKAKRRGEGSLQKATKGTKTE